jgi:hypothetical protein
MADEIRGDGPWPGRFHSTRIAKGKGIPLRQKCLPQRGGRPCALRQVSVIGTDLGPEGVSAGVVAVYLDKRDMVVIVQLQS